MAKPGPKTLLDDKLITKIKHAWQETGEVRKTAEITGIPENTLYTWKNENYLNLGDKMAYWKLQKQLEQAEAFSERLLAMKEEDEKGLNTKLISIKQREAEFLRSNLLLARKYYDKREGNTQSSGVTVNIVNYKEGDKVVEVKQVDK